MLIQEVIPPLIYLSEVLILIYERHIIDLHYGKYIAFISKQIIAKMWRCMRGASTNEVPINRNQSKIIQNTGE